MKTRCTDDKCNGTGVVDFTTEFILPKDRRVGFSCDHCGALYGQKGKRIATKSGAKAYQERGSVFYVKKDGSILL